MIQWSDDFLVGDERIDQDHQMLLGLLNEYINAREQGASSDALTRILSELVLFTRYHFLREENILGCLGLPDLEDHRKHHFDVVDKFNIKINALYSGELTHQELVPFFVDWFHSHMNEQDGMIRHHVRRIESQATIDPLSAKQSPGPSSCNPQQP